MNFMHLFKYVLLILLAASAVNAQDARLDFENLRYFEEKASEVVEVNIEGKLLDLAKRVLVKVNDKDAQRVGEAIKGLKAIYVRVFNFENENEYDIQEVEAIRSQLLSPGWEKLANVRGKKKDQKIDIYTMFSGDDLSGVAVVISQKKSVSLVNVIGPIDIDTLVEISGRLNIPKIEIEKDDSNNR